MQEPGHDYFAQALELIRDSPVDPVVKNDQVIRLVEATVVVSGDSLDRLVQATFAEEVALAAIQAIEALDVTPQDRLTQLGKIAESSSFNRMHNIDQLMSLVATLKGRPLHSEE